MPDREKVIRGLEKCGLVHRTTEDCSECPYKVKPGEFSKCWCVLCDDALDLLKEQDERIKFLEKWTAYLEGGDPYEGKGVMSHD